MAKRTVIVMHHPKTGREIKAITEQQAEIFERSDWKRGPAPKAKSTDKKEG